MNGLRLSPTGDHAAHADKIAAYLTDPRTLGPLLDQVSDDARAALKSLTPGPPTGRIGNARRDVQRATAQTAIDVLLATGILVPVDDTTVVLPREVALWLRGGVVHPDVLPAPPIPVMTERDQQAVDRLAGAVAFDLVRKVELIVDVWAAQPPPVLRAGGLSVRDWRRVPELLDTDEAAAALIVELAYVAGLIGPTNDVDTVWLPTARYDSWRRDEVAVKWATLVHAWLATSRVPGLVGTRNERDRPIGPLGRELDRPAAATIRRRVLGELAALPAGSAPDVISVLAAIQWRWPRAGGRLRDDLVRWTLQEAETLAVTGMGALASCVRPFLEDSPGDKIIAVADAVLSSMPQPLDHVLLQADLTAVAPGPLRSDLEAELNLLSDVESRGSASVHRFTAESLRRALDAGRSAADIHQFLTSVSSTAVPQPLSYLVDDVARRHGRLRVGAASSFIRCDDHALLAEIVADRRSISLGMRPIAPTVLASSLSAHVLLQRLRAMGLSPVPEASDGSLVIDRTDPRRAPVVPPRPLLDEVSSPPPTLINAAVRALRAGDRASTGHSSDITSGSVRRTDSAQTLAEIRRALETSSTVRIGYLDDHGSTTERLVDPARLEGGWMAAFDHRSGQVRSFAVHRISGIVRVDAA
jgi:hypothetical protein